MRKLGSYTALEKERSFLAHELGRNGGGANDTVADWCEPPCRRIIATDLDILRHGLERCRGRKRYLLEPSARLNSRKANLRTVASSQAASHGDISSLEVETCGFKCSKHVNMGGMLHFRLYGRMRYLVLGSFSTAESMSSLRLCTVHNI